MGYTIGLTNGLQASFERPRYERMHKNARESKMLIPFLQVIGIDLALIQPTLFVRNQSDQNDAE